MQPTAPAKRVALIASLLVAGTLAASAQFEPGYRGTTPIFPCGEDEKIPELPLDWAHIVLAGDGRLYSPCPDGAHPIDHREIREANLIGQARYSSDADLRWRAAQAEARVSTKPEPVIESVVAPRSTTAMALAQVDGLGGFLTGLVSETFCTKDALQVDDRAFQPGRLFKMLAEATAVSVVFAKGGSPVTMPPGRLGARVTMEGAYGIGVLLSRPDLNARVVGGAAKQLRSCLITAGTGELPGVLLEDLGLARYADETLADTESFLIRESYGRSEKTLGVAKALEALYRNHREHPMNSTTRLRLLRLMVQGNTSIDPQPLTIDPRIRRLAMMTLQHAKAFDEQTLRTAAADADWQVRRLAAANLDLSMTEDGGLAHALINDNAFQVRYEVLRAFALRMTSSGDCTQIVARFNDPAPVVAMRAIDLVAPTCTNLDAAVATLINLADQLDKGDPKRWQIPSRALISLARVRPAEVRSRLSGAASHPVWKVREAAAIVARTIGAENVLEALMRDREPNVQTMALDALFLMRSRLVVPQAIAVLKSGSDHQLLRKAAMVLKNMPPDVKEEASEALLAALRGLTRRAYDTSRDTRVAILERLGEALNPNRSITLLEFLEDFDPEVSKAASGAYVVLAGTAPPPRSPKRRYVYQPSLSDLMSLPTQAVIQLEEGNVSLRLLTDVAPVTVARFAELAKRNYYNGQIFHRLAPNWFIQGGSPGANDYSGTPRYMREEVGPQGVHVRTAVGMSTRGGDSSDGQFFINLVDSPQFDRDYTGFADVTAGMPLGDQLREGARSVSVTVR